MAEPTEAEIHALFDHPALRCECGHVYEEMPEQSDADWTEDGDPIDPVDLGDVAEAAAKLGARTLAAFDWQCPECGNLAAPALITANRLDEFERAWEELGDAYAMIAERIPEMRPELEAALEEAVARARDVLGLPSTA